MATNKKIIPKLFNGTDWDTLDIVTPAANVIVTPSNNIPEVTTQEHIDSLSRHTTAIEKSTWNSMIPLSQKATANGVASLDTTGKVPTSQLPSYVDDVLEFANRAGFPATGESGKIYIDMGANTTYRWSGSAYVLISASIALGETASTAYAGNKGKAVNDTVASHIANVSNPHIVTKAQIALGNVANERQYSAAFAPPYPITSVNGKTGAATLAAVDITLAGYVKPAYSTIVAADSVSSAIGKLESNFGNYATTAALNIKANIASPTFTGTVVLPSTTTIGSISNTELSYLDGTTSSIQNQINSVNARVNTKQNMITVAATSPTGNTLGDFWFQEL